MSAHALAAMGRLAPELALLLGALVPLIWGRFMAGEARARGAVAIGVSAHATASILAFGDLVHRAPGDRLLLGRLVVDGYACALRALFAWIAACVLVTLLPRAGDTSRSYRAAPRQVSLVAIALLGMSLMAMANDLVVAWLASELVALAGVGLLALGERARVRHARVATRKLVVTSAFGSVAMVFGVAVLYGQFATFTFEGIGAGISVLTETRGQVSEGVYLGGLLVFLGLAAKAGMLPLRGAHAYACRAAPVPVASLLAIGPPAATLALLVHFFDVALCASAPYPAFVRAPWTITVGIVGLATTLTAATSALREETLVGVLADLAFASHGAAMVALAVFSREGAAAALTQLVAAGFSLAALFIVAAGLVADARDRSERRVRLVSGLARRSPCVAAAVVLCLFSLAGTPPLLGFVARFHTVVALLQHGMPFSGTVQLAAPALGAIGVAMLAVAFRVARRVYATAADLEDGATLRASHCWALAALVVPFVAANVFVGVFEELAARATIWR
jgi:NADH-quinone oxidoreductase subunit N